MEGATGRVAGPEVSPPSGDPAASLLFPDLDDASAHPRRPLPVESSESPSATGFVWQRVLWTASTFAVAASAFLTGIIALWAASWIDRKSLAATAVQWDGAWYNWIAQQGYVSTPPSSVHSALAGARHDPALRPAFFPGLPLFERFLHALVGGPPATAILLAGGIGLVASCLLLRAFVGQVFGDEAAWQATVMFAFFPGAYVFLMGYSESVEIPLAILVLLSLRRRWYLLAGVAAAAATATRLTGTAVVAACLIAGLRELLVASKARKLQGPVDRFGLLSALACPLIGLGGLIGYIVYLHAKTGSYLAFQTAERKGWSNSVSLSEPYRIFRQFAGEPFLHPYVTVDVIGTIAVVACLVMLATDGLKRLRLEETVYAAIILLVWTFTTSTGAWFRFFESAFPVIVLLALRLGRRWYPAVASAGAFLLGVLLVLFSTAIAFSP